MKSTALLALGLVTVACGPVVESPQGDGDAGTTGGAATSAGPGGPGSSADGTSGPQSTSSPTDPSGPLSTVTTIATTPGETTSSAGSGSSGDPTCSFLGCPFDVPPPVECSTWDQDCGPGEKCMPWANDGGDVWNATKCVPLEPQPDGLGEPCVVEGAAVSGIDSCGVGLACWYVNDDTLEGVCIALCQGSEQDPECPACSSCITARSGVPSICVPECDPLADSCLEGSGCYYVDQQFECLPDNSPPQGGTATPCEAQTDCPHGFMCIAGPSVPGCDATDCCAPVCSLNEFDACADVAGTSCTEIAFASRGCRTADVGVCALPP